MRLKRWELEQIGVTLGFDGLSWGEARRWALRKRYTPAEAAQIANAADPQKVEPSAVIRQDVDPFAESGPSLARVRDPSVDTDRNDGATLGIVAPMLEKTTKKRGFAAMSLEERKRIASLGGRKTSANKEHMATIGRAGGTRKKSRTI